LALRVESFEVCGYGVAVCGDIVETLSSSASFFLEASKFSGENYNHGSLAIMLQFFFSKAFEIEDLSVDSELICAKISLEIMLSNTAFQLANHHCPAPFIEIHYES
jgi:hypothetical protein